MRKSMRVILPALILFVGITLMVAGVLQGEPQYLLRKATVICLECIGIG